MNMYEGRRMPSADSFTEVMELAQMMQIPPESIEYIAPARSTSQVVEVVNVQLILGQLEDREGVRPPHRKFKVRKPPRLRVTLGHVSEDSNG